MKTDIKAAGGSAAAAREELPLPPPLRGGAPRPGPSPAGQATGHAPFAPSPFDSAPAVRNKSKTGEAAATTLLVGGSSQGAGGVPAGARSSESRSSGSAGWTSKPPLASQQRPVSPATSLRGLIAGGSRPSSAAWHPANGVPAVTDAAAAPPRSSGRVLQASLRSAALGGPPSDDGSAKSSITLDSVMSQVRGASHHRPVLPLPPQPGVSLTYRRAAADLCRPGVRACPQVQQSGGQGGSECRVLLPGVDPLEHGLHQLELHPEGGCGGGQRWCCGCGCRWVGGRGKGPRRGDRGASGRGAARARLLGGGRGAAAARRLHRLPVHAPGGHTPRRCCCAPPHALPCTACRCHRRRAAGGERPQGRRPAGSNHTGAVGAAGGGGRLGPGQRSSRIAAPAGLPARHPRHPALRHFLGSGHPPGALATCACGGCTAAR
jgi:hypothetical protein